MKTRDLIMKVWGKTKKGKSIVEKIKNPSWKEVQKYLLNLEMGTGYLEIYDYNDPIDIPYEISLICKFGEYRLYLLTEDTKLDSVVLRSLYNPKGKEEFIKKHGEDRVMYDGMGYGSDGELYPLSDFCYDFESVKKAFKEFVLTGDVSWDLMV